MDAVGDHEIQWNSQLEKILAQEAERSLCYSVMHRESEGRYSTLNNYIALPCIVLSTLTGATSVGSQTLFGDSQYAAVGIGVVSITVGILQTLNSYFSWARRAEGHKSSSIQYGKLHRFLMIELSLPRTSRMTAKDLLKTMRDQMDRLFETSPALHPLIVDQFKAKYKDNKDISRPEIANGLDAVEIFDDSIATPHLVLPERVDASTATAPRVSVRVVGEI